MHDYSESDHTQYEIDPLTKLPNPPPIPYQESGEQGWPPRGSISFDWSSCEPWLAARGYKLYSQSPRKRWFPPPFTAPASPPYATCVRADRSPEHLTPPMYKIAWAQDSLNRDVALKIINRKMEEYPVYQTLLRHAERVGDGRCVGVLLPLAILDTPFGYSFVVMPRWGALRKLDRFDTVKDVLQFMRCTLEGLVLLHSYRIAHRDIRPNNMLVDCYSPDIEIWKMDPVLDNHRCTSQLGAQYCLFDFDTSIQLPPDTCLRGSRRPARESRITVSPFQPADIDLGEHAYNPFAYDVACLGNVYRVWFSRAAAAVPLLALFMDKMTDREAYKRFTAEEALAFLNHVISQLSADAWNTSVSLKTDFRWTVIPAAYWSWTPPGFADVWSLYQTKPWSWTEHVIDRICSYPVGWRAVGYMRSILQR